ncbi:MAG: HAD-superfamily hydrolase, subfamily IIA [Candidatus Wolfebacteria bacterium GW2011_GWE1_48_7]|uniref:HAD-superfamily hydrolase, subfamily IIA n=2 Tax=Candidatus Wolfeibacteriota TaxID=1752735 RepID=A0A0G1U775_9BACT|nr:MAG: haloacid dehalogenase domain protein hydrolase, 4-nitrophenyl phosphatase [Candidatus Wolfebacteria bacterium GW2011_GWB1_47_1]KKU36890.1 MAG: HAD-superfamily hydrolase, subfamily IIA [Candidatus Wolfebacteria bacterium GW2011_GWC2_46_275]KKU41590.1 MAG: HAD-superfamily hydrolase, subfamily IIA [Candidatus Wolfebacteria bacterium GW2011_GWB2_46_69]KKU53759.1 MAG: HAD-superfamily hydrolase, subfamily IIA [Candidatus Wolfebacteria bacterium GW2011_GWC1_47_103]KKU59878.1 MAG: HAD-superfami
MIDSIVFDLDGTLYLGEKVVEGAIETIAALEAEGYRIFYLTNNSGKMRKQIVDKLNNLGFPAHSGNTYCIARGISHYLVEEEIGPIYLIGTNDLRRELMSNEIVIKEDPGVSAVVVGIDPAFSYQKIAMALDAIDGGAKLIVANGDSSYPIENNRRLPGCGALVAAIVNATGHAPDVHVGKPNTYMLELLCREHGLSPERICVVGDMPESDIRMANNFNCQSILFDPGGNFSDFSNMKARALNEIISLLKKGR